MSEKAHQQSSKNGITVYGPAELKESGNNILGTSNIIGNEALTRNIKEILVLNPDLAIKDSVRFDVYDRKEEDHRGILLVVTKKNPATEEEKVVQVFSGISALMPNKELDKDPYKENKVPKLVNSLVILKSYTHDEGVKDLDKPVILRSEYKGPELPVLSTDNIKRIEVLTMPDKLVESGSKNPIFDKLIEKGPKDKAEEYTTSQNIPNVAPNTNKGRS